jgi:hypothetical protein
MDLIDLIESLPKDFFLFDFKLNQVWQIGCLLYFLKSEEKRGLRDYSRYYLSKNENGLMEIYDIDGDGNVWKSPKYRQVLP